VLRSSQDCKQFNCRFAATLLSMARALNPDKRAAILQAAVDEVAEVGLGAATSKIAARAGVATGSLFTYFATKRELLNELYFELKLEVYAQVNSGFPHKAGLEKRARHLWTSFLDWSIEFPEKRKVSLQLNVSDVITPETRARTAEARCTIDAVLAELGTRGALRGLPPSFASAFMGSLQEATMDFITKQPERREELSRKAFQVFWRALES
jgi:AcrR family transcriptional regulator